MTVHIFGGGTFSHIRPHLALCAPAFGKVAQDIRHLIKEVDPTIKTVLHLTRMAGGDLETNDDVDVCIGELIEDPQTSIIFMAAALCDFDGAVLSASGRVTASGKNQPRLKTKDGEQWLQLTPAEKILGKIRKTKKHIFLVGFKTTAGATAEEQYQAGLELLKKNSCNLVLANDIHTRLNMVVAPELARYYETTDRTTAIRGLVDMTLKRSKLSFTPTTVVKGDILPWSSPKVPASLRTVVDYCVDRGAYRPFNGVTVGHFAFQDQAGELFSSRRKQDFNQIECRDLVRVEFYNMTQQVIAFGAKPSAGARSQYQVLNHFYHEYDCIVHFHCPAKPGSVVTRRPQHDFECGSHECGANTLDGMTRYGNLAAVMLDNHGPNIIFDRNIDPQEVISFIEANFDLSRRSDGIS